MSLCRVIIRLEITDTANLFINLQYSADTGVFLTSSEPVSSQQQHKTTHLDSKRIDLYRGRRQYRVITIEQYLVSCANSNTEDASIMSSGDVDGESSANQPSTPNKWASWSDPDADTVAQVADGDDYDAAEMMKSGSAKMFVKGSMSTGIINFFSGNPSVETTEGFIHLYKEDDMTPLKGDVTRSSVVCMLNVPAMFSSQDLLQFVAPVEPGLKHIRIVRDGTPNQYLVLLTFRDQKCADEFYEAYNDHPFNTIEPDICHLAYVSRVESLLSSQGAGLPPPCCTELPNCTVCLERMDESVKGILTILCNHSFHVACLAEWKDTSCPVCRYVQAPVPTADHKCFECSAQVNLWICLICGFVGCGRYVEGHAYGHFKDTAHTYSMELGTNRVWDYAGDNYVHRLVQNKADGKLVEVDERSNVLQEEKIDALNLEYTYLLTSQLESQRLYFEEKIQNVERQSQRQVEELETKVKKALEEMTKLEQQLAGADKEKKVMVDDSSKLEQQLSSVTKDKQKLATRVTKMTQELEEEKQLNRCLRENQSQWQHKVSELEDRLAKKDIEMAELRDQLRDVMFFLEAKDTLATTSSATQQEIQEGQIIVQQNPADTSPAGASSGRRGRGKKR